MRIFFRNIYRSLPLQLFLLHFRKYQVLLLFWVILFSTVNSSFLKVFGADALFFTPEYLGRVNITGALITGAALGIFIMSWNITTFIMHSRRLKFLATTADPFLKYCINNGMLPLIFLIFYFAKLLHFDAYHELMGGGAIAAEMIGIVIGLVLLIAFSFAYFFGAGRTIERSMTPLVADRELFNKTFTKENYRDDLALKVDWYLSARLRVRKCRNVSHYRRDFLEAIFKRHHIAAMLSVLVAFMLLVTTGFLLDYKVFEMPAAASALVVFSLLIALIGALVYFMESWSLPAVILLLLGLNFLYTHGVIDPRNKAYGLSYDNVAERPAYSKASLQSLCTPAEIAADRQNMIAILDRWKARQPEVKPLMVFINVSGGGLRSAAFTMNTLQQTDSLTGGNLMRKTFLISGASGGMLAAAYYRELYKKKLADSSLDISDLKYTDNIAGDLLNPVFSSLMARDIFAPMQKFSVGDRVYVKDRGYAFEKKLDQNCGGLLNKQLRDFAADESAARIPMIIFNAVIKPDARKLVIGTQPLSFMMKPFASRDDTAASPDAVDFGALFKRQSPMDLRLLTALRMNATFPYVLPNVWLPSEPVIDVMDAGLRDNYGRETTLRFIDYFKDWIRANTSGVLLLEIRDRQDDDWQQPYETKSITDMIVTPATMLQYNLFKLQDYFQSDQYSYFADGAGFPMYKASVMYTPEKKEETAALNFHLSARDKRDVLLAYRNAANTAAIRQIAVMLK